MLAADLKAALSPDGIVMILEALGCQQIRMHNKYISSTRGSGSDNKAGVVVYLDGNYNAIMPTTPEFDDYPVKDIIAVVQQLLGCSFPMAMHFICETIGIDYDNVIPQKPSILSWLDQVECSISENQEKQPEKINENILNSFIPYPHIAWITDGISHEIINKFGIGYDVIDDCITIPVYNEIGVLCGIKCRSMGEVYDSKYWYMCGCEKSKILYGLYQNYADIQNAGTCIVYEAEKSVLKSCSLGIRNCVALSGKVISDYQAELLVRLGVTVIIALDNDVSDAEIDEAVAKIKNPIQLCRVEVLRDDLGLYLGEKDSPADNKEFMLHYQMFSEEV